MYKQRRPTMNDLDVQLIREFALRPIIYNKATPFFKNKYLTDCAWDEIAAKVGGDGESFSTDFISLFVFCAIVAVVVVLSLPFVARALSFHHSHPLSFIGLLFIN